MTASPQAPRQRRGEAGSTLVLVLVISAILLVVAAVVIRGATSDVGTAGYDRSGKAAFLCAESGIRVGMTQLANDSTTYTATLRCGTTDGGAGCGACSGSLACPLHVTNDGGAYVDVWLTDNVDDSPNDPRTDADQQVYINARCTQTGLPPRQLQILFSSGGGGQYYRNQAGQGSTNAGNQNVK
ncbi:MAG TPA: pilus assembly PilX N-terminal domain-containing protein [Polyangia bacterium]